MKKVIHPVAGAVALLTTATFWLSTAATELFGSTGAVAAVKTAIPWGFLLLVPAMATVGATGFSVVRGRTLGGIVKKKAGRMPILTVNGLFILIPSALFLASRARAGNMDTWFYVVQVVELVAGATNITLMGLSMRDGLKMKGRLRKPKAA